MASSCRQLQVCRIEHLDSETRYKIEITHGFPLCPRTALVQRSRLALNEHCEEPAASYRWSGWSFKTSGKLSTYTQARARTGLRTKHSKVRNASYKGKTPTTTTTKLLWVEESVGSVCVCLWTSTFASNYRQLQLCRIEHLDSKTRNEIEIIHGFPLCACTALVQPSRLVLSEQGEPAASYVRTHYITFAMSVAR